MEKVFAGARRCTDLRWLVVCTCSVLSFCPSTTWSRSAPAKKVAAVATNSAAFPSTELAPVPGAGAEAQRDESGNATGTSISVTATLSETGTLVLAQEASSTPLSLDGPQEAASTAVLKLNLHERLHWSALADKNGYSLNELLQIAAQANPNWGTFAANHAAAHAEVIAASVYPNPEIEAELGSARAREAEEGGGRPARAIWSLSVSQPIEMPGKRLARRVEAESGFAVVAGETLEYNSTLRAEVVEAYYTVQYYTALVRLQETLTDLAERLLGIANTRIELGVAGTVERVNSRVALLPAQRDLAVARRQMLGARAALNALLGGRLSRNFTLSDGLKDRFPQIGYEESVKVALGSHPRLLRLAAELEQRYASLDRARTEWWPDLKIGAQKSRDFDTDSVAVTAGIEIPLWNRNQGGAARAEAEAQKKYNDIVIAMTELRRDAEVSYQNYRLAVERVGFYTDGLKQAAQDALEIATLQYSEGAAGYLDLLTARQVLQETEQEYLEALYNAALAQARLQRARGEVIRREPERGRKDGRAQPDRAARKQAKR